MLKEVDRIRGGMPREANSRAAVFEKSHLDTGSLSEYLEGNSRTVISTHRRICAAAWELDAKADRIRRNDPHLQVYGGITFYMEEAHSRNLREPHAAIT